MTDADVSELLPSGRQTYFANRVGWARTYLKKAGLIDSPAKGMFCITAEGKKVVQEDPPVIDNSYLMRYDSFKAFTQPADAQTNTAQNEDDSETPDDALENAFNKINQSLADDILSEVMKLSPTAFEKMVLDLMAKMGYGTFANAATTTSITGDEGIDGIIFSVRRHPAWLLLPPSVGAHPSIAGSPGAGRPGRGCLRRADQV